MHALCKLRHLLILLIVSSLQAADPVISNVVPKIIKITDNGKGMLYRTFEVTFDLADADNDKCRIFAGVRGIERTPVIENEGPYLFYTALAGDTATTPGQGKKVTFTVADTAGEFDSVRIKISAWDYHGWPPWPNKPCNPRHHGWALDIRNGPVHEKSGGFIALLKQTSPAFLSVVFDFTIFTVLSSHPSDSPVITDYPDESDLGAVPFPDTSLGDPFNAYPEGNNPGQSCDNDGDCHIEIIDVESWRNWSMWRCFKKGAGPFDWKVANGALFPWNAETFPVKDTITFTGGITTFVGAYRPITWTSGDAAGLSIVPGVVKLHELDEGEIHHALRTCTKGSAPYFVHPASHRAGSLTDPYAAPMGLRFRLKSSFDINKQVPLQGSPGTDTFRDSRAARIILRALQKYGMINADNSGWSAGYLMAEKDDHTQYSWDNLLVSNSVSKYVSAANISVDDFEVVDWNWQYLQYENYEKLK